MGGRSKLRHYRLAKRAWFRPATTRANPPPRTQRARGEAASSPGEVTWWRTGSSSSASSSRVPNLTARLPHLRLDFGVIRFIDSICHRGQIDVCGVALASAQASARLSIMTAAAAEVGNPGEKTSDGPTIGAFPNQASAITADVAAAAPISP